MAAPGRGPSPLAAALARVGDRWTLLVVEALLPAPRRFNDPSSGWNATGCWQPGPTPGGRPAPPASSPPAAPELAAALRLLARWGSRHTGQAGSPRHRASRTPIEVRWYCPTCDQLARHEPDHPHLHFV